MSYLHTPRSKGYTDSSGKFNNAVMLVGESNEERLEAYDWLTKTQQDIDDLQTLNLLPGWNHHDDDVIPGIAENIGPIHRGGRFKDIVKYQLEKLFRALVKVERAVEQATGHTLSIPDYFIPKNVAETEPMLSNQLVKRYNDVRRDGEAEQQDLKQNPDLITDRYANFKDVWGWYLKKKKKK